MLDLIRPLIPKKLFKAAQPWYHRALALFGAIWFGFPAKKLQVVAITGTKGKTSTAEMVNAILEEAGKKTALSGSLRFKIGDTSTLNPFGMSMPGRSYLQKFLKDAVRQRCDWAVVEMTSEGAKQFRHKHIDLDAFIFTNLAPEHIESHGSFEQYLSDKKRIATLLSDSSKKRRVAIINGDDPYADEFTPKKVTEVVRYRLEEAKIYSSDQTGTSFQFDGATIFSPLRGEFNIRNMLAAAHFAKAFGIETPIIARAFSKLKTIRGRGEQVTLPENHPLRNKQQFEIVVDYAHTIESLEALYKTFQGHKKICVLGNAGGGRDTWKRSGMAKVADTYCDAIILTTEDPYDENPREIIAEMEKGISKHIPNIILDRREAIHTALKAAQPHDVVLLSGMGSQQYMSLAHGKKIPWDDAQVAREELEKVLNEK